MRQIGALLVLLASVGGCVVTPISQPQKPQSPVAQPTPQASRAPAGPANFKTVATRVERVAERTCVQNRVANCDFLIVLDNRPGVPPNAYQTLDDYGRPVLIVTGTLLRQMQNADELAFVLGHEAAHHIAGHIPKTQQSAVLGAVLLGTVAGLGGGNAAAIEAAQDIGASVGSRTFSKSFELEADSLGTVIAWNAGYDPVRGADFFARIPDPGDQFLGSHPPNADRQKVVRATAAKLG
ncbi:MAG: M48 family metallopeptidase [Mangrovicoccus sp.]|nr:M48 family metallopeptidase [Mangrovicoccus sp.]